MSGELPMFPMNFNPMGTGQVSNPLAGSIDALFNAYKLSQATKLQNAQLPGIQAATEAQQLANQGTAFQQAAAGNEYAASHYGFSPQQLAQGFQNLGSYQPPSPNPEGGPQSMYATPTQGLQAQPVNQAGPVGGLPNPNVTGAMYSPGPMPQPGLQSPQGQVIQPQGSGPFGHASPEEAAQNLMRFAQMGQQLGAASAMAGLNAKGAEANKNQAEANKSNLLVNLLSGQGGADSIKLLADRAQKGLEDPSLSGLGRGEDQSALRMALGLELARRGVDTSQLQAQYDARQEATKTKASSTAKVQGGDTQQIGTIAGVVEDTLDSAAPLVKSLNTDKIALVNKGFLQGKKALNDPQATALLTKLNILKNRYAVVSSYPNAPTKEQYDEASKLISDGLTSGSFDAMAQAMKQEGNSIVARAGGNGFNEPNPNSGPALKIGRFSVQVH